MIQATLSGETFGIGATEGTAGADAVAVVMLILFVVILSLILLVARGIAKRTANPLPEQVLLQEIGATGTNRTLLAEPGEHDSWPPENGDPQSAPMDDAPSNPELTPWEKPADWWRKLPQ